MHSTIYGLSDTDTSLATASPGEKGGPTQGALTDMQNLYCKDSKLAMHAASKESSLIPVL